MKIGYQLYSALPLCETKEGMIETIKKVASFGYDGVEFFTYAGMTAEEMRALLLECGLEACNSHVQLERWEADPEGEIRYAKEAGIPYVTIPWISPDLLNEAGYAKIKDLIRRVVPICKEYGVKLVYHNHDFEFVKGDDGKFILEDVLSAEKDCGLELDTFWSFFAGADSVAYMEEMKDRLAMIHVKDYLKLDGGGEAGGSEMPIFCAIGTGKMENEPIVTKADELGIEWVVVEQDNSQIDLMESARISMENLKKLR